ncbi:hypothetical protein ABPG72_005287 [Tetrahymena utriculariae]
MKIASLLIITFVALASADTTTTTTNTTGLNTNLIDCVSQLTLPYQGTDAAGAQLYQDFMTNFQACQASDWNTQYACIQTAIKEIPLSQYAKSAQNANSQNISNLQTYGNQIISCMKNNIVTDTSSVNITFSFLLLAIFALAF